MRLMIRYFLALTALATLVYAVGAPYTHGG